MPDELRILLVEPDGEVRSGVAGAVHRTFPEARIDEAVDERSLEAALAAEPRQLVITGHGAEWPDAVEITAAVKARSPSTAVVLFGPIGLDEVAVAAMKHGLDDYVVRTPGRIAGLTVALHQLLSRRRAGHHAEVLERRFRSLFEQAPLGIFRTSVDGRIVDANPMLARILGARSARDVVGRLASDFYADPEARERWLRDLREDGAVTAVELTLRRADDAEVRVRLSARRVPGEGGTEWIEGVVEDVSEREAAAARMRELERQLRHAQKMEALGRLAGGVAHDFNNLLTVILGHASLVQESLRGGGARPEDVAPIVVAARRATEMTRHLLSLSHRHEGEAQTVEPGAILKELSPMLRRLLGEDVVLDLSLPDTAWSVRIDPAHLSQVVLNLAVNARDAMPDGGRLRIGVQHVDLGPSEAAGFTELRPGPHVEISVSDTGPGISEDIRARIFEPFFTTKEALPGAGLGLPIVAEIVKQWSGALRVDSAPGAGTTFRMLLPRVTPRRAAQPARKVPVPAAGATILVAEDDDGLRELLTQTLKRHGHDVLAAADGPEAIRLSKLHSGGIDLLVSDVVMPTMTGPELAERLRQERPALRAVFMTGHAGDLARRRVAIPSDLTWLAKPFSLDRLVETVHVALAG